MTVMEYLKFVAELKKIPKKAIAGAVDVLEFDITALEAEEEAATKDTTTEE